MTSISKIHSKLTAISLLAVASIFFALWASEASAQAISFSVTPSLIEVSAEPGRSWESSIKVVNNNAFDLTVYAEVLNFEPLGESGQSTFIPISQTEQDGTTIAEWFTVSSDPVVIPRESSAAVPIKLTVPASAAPGGHYAAIQIGTRPPETSGEQIVRTSQIVTALFFARVAGDVVESGTVRSFRANQILLGRPEATFELRFENKGNVHLQPQGEIIIKNMWGAVRGTIPINQQTHFGNVLPESIRLFEFTWSGAFSLADIGRYTAEVTLAYGDDARQFTNRTTSFYVVPIKALTLSILLLLALILFARFVIRSYVRRMLVLAGVDPDVGRGVIVRAGKLPGSDVRITATRVSAPVRAGYLDYRTRLRSVYAYKDKFLTTLHFVLAYRAFFLSILAIMVIVYAVTVFFGVVTKTDVPYEVTIEGTGEDVTLSSEQIHYNSQNETSSLPSVEELPVVNAQDFTLILTNASGKSGVAAALKTELESSGYEVDELRSDLTGTKKRSVIVYAPELEREALRLSEALRGALLSADATGASEGTVNVFVGADWVD